VRRVAAILALALVPPGLAARGAADGEMVVRDAYLMGTRVSLAAWATDRAEGLRTLERALQLLETTEAELSTWRADSAISGLNRHPVGSAFELPHDLCGTFAALYEWHAATAGTFDPAIGPITDAWGIHAGGRVPPPHILREARESSGLDKLTFDGARCTVTRRADVRVDAGGFGKGDALDRVERALRDGPWMADLGGQVSVHGRPGGRPWQVGVAHPRDRHRALLYLQLSEGSLATSGASERDLAVNGRRVGHILDPRTGEPAAFEGSVVVWHRRALAADILSTALYVMGRDAGLAFAERRRVAACFLVPAADGTVRIDATAAFRELMPVSAQSR
jgi:thiamine biosynthesis lipoprotein